MTASQAEDHYSVEIQSRHHLNELQRLEQTHGDTVHDWLAEGMPREAMGTPEKMRAFRNENEKIGSSTAENRSRQVVQRMVPQNQGQSPNRGRHQNGDESSQNASTSNLGTIEEVDQHAELEFASGRSTWSENLWGSLATTDDLSEGELLPQPAQQLHHQANEILVQGHAIRHEKQALHNALETQKQNLETQFRRRATRLVSRRQPETNIAKQRVWHRALEENISLQDQITNEQQKLAADVELDRIMNENAEMLLRIQPLAEREAQGESLREMLAAMFPQVVEDAELANILQETPGNSDGEDDNSSSFGDTESEAESDTDASTEAIAAASEQQRPTVDPFGYFIQHEPQVQQEILASGSRKLRILQQRVKNWTEIDRTAGSSSVVRQLDR